jgi:hypothetical protein
MDGKVELVEHEITTIKGETKKLMLPKCRIQSIKIIIKRDDGKFLELPITKDVLRDIYDGFYMLCEDCWHDAKNNRIETGIREFQDMLEFLIHDVIDDGMVTDGNGKWSQTFIVEKPKWKNQQNSGIKT